MLQVSEPETSDPIVSPGLRHIASESLARVPNVETFVSSLKYYMYLLIPNVNIDQHRNMSIVAVAHESQAYHLNNLRLLQTTVELFQGANSPTVYVGEQLDRSENTRNT